MYRLKSRRSLEAHVQVLLRPLPPLPRQHPQETFGWRDGSHMSPYAQKNRKKKAEWRCHDALSNSLFICYLVCTVGNHPLSRDVAVCTCGCLANWGGAPKHDLENERTTSACVHSAVQARSATQCICVAARSCNCHDTLQHRSLLLRRHD